jgi:hypothetical protein
VTQILYLSSLQLVAMRAHTLALVEARLAQLELTPGSGVPVTPDVMAVRISYLTQDCIHSAATRISGYHYSRSAHRINGCLMP